MKISHPERGGNGVRPRVVNQSLQANPLKYGGCGRQNQSASHLPCPGFRQSVAANHHCSAIWIWRPESFWLCKGTVVWWVQGRKRTLRWLRLWLR